MVKHFKKLWPSGHTVAYFISVAVEEKIASKCQRKKGAF